MRVIEGETPLSSDASQPEREAGCSAATVQRLDSAPAQATTYADGKAIRRAVLATLPTTERSLHWRVCIGMTAVCVGLAALLAIVFLVTQTSR